MEQLYRVIVQTAGLSPDTVRALASQLAGQPEVNLSVGRLVARLGGDPLALVGAVTLDRANALGAIVSEAGGTTQLVGVSAAATTSDSPRPVRPEAAVPSATMIGGFHAPGPTRAPLGPADGVSESDLLTLDQAADLSLARTGHRTANDARDATAARLPPGEATRRRSSSVPDVGAALSGKATDDKNLDVDSLDASSLVMLDGSDESQVAVPAASPRPAPTADRPAQPPDDPRFRPPEAEGGFGPPGQDDVLELDVKPAVRADPAVATPTEASGAPEAVDVPDSNEEPPPDQARDDGPTMGLKTSRGRGSARRRRMTIAVIAELRKRAHLRVALGFAFALGLGAILPTCHARSVMSSEVQSLRVELSTAKAHGVSATPGFASIEQIEHRISSVKLRHGFYSFFLWLGGTGLLLFLWFRFV